MSSVPLIRQAAPRRGSLSRLLFPPVRARFSIALLLTFFPYAILYPLDYPAGEILTLCCWVWVFPSPMGWIAMGALPLIPHATYGYYAFNLFCTLVCLSIASSVYRSDELEFADMVALHKFARGCMAVTLGIALLQAVTDPYRWMRVFTNMRLEAGRGAGMRLEPSQLSCLLALHLALVACRMEIERRTRRPIAGQQLLLREAILAILMTLVLTRSFSVLIVVLCFVPALLLRRRHLRLLLATCGIGGIAGAAALGDRIRDALATSGGSMGDLITAGVDSWRNVPDLLILSNPGDFLLPGNPAEVRIKIHTLAYLTSPLMGWIQNTFSSFSAASVSVGLVLTGLLIAVGLIKGMRSLSGSSPMRLSWLLVYATAWFFMAKWDPSAWVVLGLLPLSGRIRRPAATAAMVPLRAPKPLTMERGRLTQQPTPLEAQ